MQFEDLVCYSWQQAVTENATRRFPRMPGISGSAKPGQRSLPWPRFLRGRGLATRNCRSFQRAEPDWAGGASRRAHGRAGAGGQPRVVERQLIDAANNLVSLDPPLPRDVETRIADRLAEHARFRRAAGCASRTPSRSVAALDRGPPLDDRAWVHFSRLARGPERRPRAAGPLRARSRASVDLERPSDGVAGDVFERRRRDELVLARMPRRARRGRPSASPLVPRGSPHPAAGRCRSPPAARVAAGRSPAARGRRLRGGPGCPGPGPPGASRQGPARARGGPTRNSRRNGATSGWPSASRQPGSISSV